MVCGEGEYQGEDRDSGARAAPQAGRYERNHRFRALVSTRDAVFWESLHRLCARIPARLCSVQSARAAVAVACQLEPALIIIDLDDEPAGEARLIGALRDRAPGARIVVVAESPTEAASASILSAGANAYVRKDLREGLLLSMVRVALGRPLLGDGS